MTVFGPCGVIVVAATVFLSVCTVGVHFIGFGIFVIYVFLFGDAVVFSPMGWFVSTPVLSIVVAVQYKDILRVVK